jgi:hypothetical protein
MIGSEYKSYKKKVIDLFESYKARRGSLVDGSNINFLEHRIDSLKNNKYTLAVAGEVKAGKSTFINALLGAEILPSDVLQATNAIVEIFKSDTSYLMVEYADGKDEIIKNNSNTADIDEANIRLHEICKIHDDYRQIPTTIIDNYIIESEEVLTVDESFVQHLEEQSDEKLQDKINLIKKFISERTKDKIPVKIEYGYPLKWDFDELRIVDSPGVNATGGVQDVAFQFYEDADAILFIHPIKPIESKSFRKFVDSVITERSKETLFLILTHTGLFEDDEVKRLHSEAERLYRNIIPQDRILAVDSLLQLIHCDLEKGTPLTEIRKSKNKKKILSSYREQAEDECRELIDVLSEGARFEEMFDAIDKFSMDAPYLQLIEILEKIITGYEDQENQFTEKAQRLEQKKKNPQEFEEEITRINNALEEYILQTKQINEDLKSSYSGRHSLWQKQIEQLKVKYPELITGSDSIENTRKHIVDSLNAVQDIINLFSKELTLKLKEVITKTGNTFKETYSISIPKIDLQALEEKAKNNAYKLEKTGYWDKEPIWKFWKWGNRDIWVSTGTKKVFDDDQFLREYKTRCNEEFYEIVNDLPNKTKELLDIYLNLFSDAMTSIINDRQKELEKEKNKKQSNKEIIIEIEELCRKKEQLQPEKQCCIEILEDLK